MNKVDQIQKVTPIVKTVRVKSTPENAFQAFAEKNVRLVAN
jgi:hypothetical protein